MPIARDIVGDDPIIGRSTHSPDQFDAALVETGVDYVCAGPTWITPTKPGRPAAGLVADRARRGRRHDGQRRGSRSAASRTSTGSTR